MGYIPFLPSEQLSKDIFSIHKKRDFRTMVVLYVSPSIVFSLFFSKFFTDFLEIFPYFKYEGHPKNLAQIFIKTKTCISNEKLQYTRAKCMFTSILAVQRVFTPVEIGVS